MTIKSRNVRQAVHFALTACASAAVTPLAYAADAAASLSLTGPPQFAAVPAPGIRRDVAQQPRRGDREMSDVAPLGLRSSVKHQPAAYAPG